MTIPLLIVLSAAALLLVAWVVFLVVDGADARSWQGALIAMAIVAVVSASLFVAGVRHAEAPRLTLKGATDGKR